MELLNLAAGIMVILAGIAIILVGSYFGRKMAGIYHVVIYFMASFVVFGGVLIALLYDRAPIFQ